MLNSPVKFKVKGFRAKNLARLAKLLGKRLNKRLFINLDNREIVEISYTNRGRRESILGKCELT